MTQAAKSQPAPRRGRPTKVDPAQISTVALHLFERRGFDAVTMQEVADAAGVSQRTLFRHFPSKSDLVWDGLHGIREVVSAQAAALRGSGLTPAELVLAIAEPCLRPLEEPARARLSRRRLRLIAQVPALLHHPALRQVEEVLASLFSPRPEHPALVARSAVSLGVAALFWWAEQDTLTPLEAVRAAFHGLVASSNPPRSR